MWQENNARENVAIHGNKQLNKTHKITGNFLFIFVQTQTFYFTHAQLAQPLAGSLMT